MDYLLGYIIISYIVGALLYLHEMMISWERRELQAPLWLGLILLALSPLTAWHGVLHYVAVVWHRFKGTPFKPFI